MSHTAPDEVGGHSVDAESRFYLKYKLWISGTYLCIGTGQNYFQLLEGTQIQIDRISYIKKLKCFSCKAQTKECSPLLPRCPPLDVPGGWRQHPTSQPPGERLMVKRDHVVKSDGGRSYPHLEGWKIILLVEM